MVTYYRFSCHSVKCHFETPLWTFSFAVGLIRRTVQCPSKRLQSSVFYHPSYSVLLSSVLVISSVTMMMASQMRRLMGGGCLTWRRRLTVRGSALTECFAWMEKVGVNTAVCIVLSQREAVCPGFCPSSSPTAKPTSTYYIQCLCDSRHRYQLI